MGKGALRLKQPFKVAGSRGMATEQQLRIRIATVSNVKKITSTMKMISAAKLRAAQRNLEITRAFSEGINDVWPAGEVPETPAETTSIIGLTSDKGLCGAANSTISRGVRDHMLKSRKNGEDTKYELYVVGEKGRGQLNRMFSDTYQLSITDYAKLKTFTFKQSCALISHINRYNIKNGLLFSLYFRSMVAYDLKVEPWTGYEEALGDGSAFTAYEVNGDADCMENFHQWVQGVRFFSTMAECDASVLSSRMAAMENSSKSAGDMLTNLTTIMNRTRQGKITTELIEIISGATAAAEMQ